MYQKGRTTLELFAVFLIVGVLTIASLEMFSYVFAKNTANAIKKTADSRAASILTSPSLVTTEVGHSLDALGFLKKEENFTWTHTKESSNAFSITISPVKKKVCNLLLSMDTSYLKELRVDGKTNENAVCSDKGSEMTFVYATGSIKRAPVQPKKCSGNETKCGLGCCPHGTDCCNGMCVEKCAGIGMDGSRNAFTCGCLCDETLGLVFNDAIGGCVCSEGKHYENGRCICDNSQCEGGKLTPDCSCNCAATGKKHKKGEKGVCVECNDNSDCSSASCETCDNNVCVGKCCVKNGLKCDETDKCCNGQPCSDMGYCCLDNGSACETGRDCCIGSCSNAGYCCLDPGKLCKDESECCNSASCKDNRCCHELGKTCASTSECCGSLQNKGVTCYRNLCCLERGQACTPGSNECCFGDCVDGRCCTDFGDRCQIDSECCGGICFNNRCCVEKGGECSATKPCCIGACSAEGKCCTPLGNQCISNSDCCEGDCVNGICCMGAGNSCDDMHPCCGGNTCQDGICCPSDGMCGNVCNVCCEADIGSSCSWSIDEKNAWTGVCTPITGPFFGLDEKKKEVRCCHEGEYLVPSFSDDPNILSVTQFADKYCCPVKKEGREVYTYYNKNTGKCSILGECPSEYDGVAFIIDVSGSMSGQRLKIMKNELQTLFSTTEIAWDKLNVGIYSFCETANTVLHYGKYSVNTLKNKVASLFATGGTCQEDGLNKAWQDTFADGKKAAPLFFLLADGEDGVCVDTLNSNHYYFPTQVFASNAAKVVNNMNEDCYNLFQLHALGFGGVRDASSFKLPNIPGKVFAYSVSTNSLKDVMLSITKKNLNNCIPREENEICCKKGTKWDDEDKKCK